MATTHSAGNVSPLLFFSFRSVHSATGTGVLTAIHVAAAIEREKSSPAGLIPIFAQLARTRLPPIHLTAPWGWISDMQIAQADTPGRRQQVPFEG